MRSSSPRYLTFWFALLLPWLLVLGIAPLRTLMLAQFRGGGSYLQWPEGLNYGSLATRFPHDLRVQIGVAKQGQTDLVPVTESRKGGGRAYLLKRVVERFPQSPLAHADYLRFSLGWMQDGRLAGDLDRPPPPPYTAPPEEQMTTANTPWGNPGSYPNFTLQEWQDALSAARHGQQLEPHNAYYDWAEVCLLLNGHHDEEAARALQRGSLKAYYDDHILESTAASIATQEQLYPLLLEDRLSVEAAELFVHTTKYRQAARVIAWRAWKLTRAGRHTEALTLRSDLARMGRLIQRDRNAQLTQQIGSALQSVAWNCNLSYLRSAAQARKWRNLALQEAGHPTIRLNRLAQGYAAYARLHGRADLTHETTQFHQENSAFRHAIERPTQHWNGLSDATMTQVRSCWWLGLGCFWLSAFLLLLRLPLSLWLWRAEEGEPTSALSLIAGSLALTSLAALGGLHWGVATDVYLAWMTSDISGSAFDSPPGSLCALAFFFITPAVALGSVFPSLWQIKKRARARRMMLSDFHNTPFFSDAPRSILNRLPHDQKGRFFAFLWASPLLVFLNSFVVRLALLPVEIVGLDRSSTTQALDTLGATLFFLSGFALLCQNAYQWRFRLPLADQIVAHRAVRRAHTTLSGVLLVASWAYMATLSLSLIPRHEAEVQFDLYLRAGLPNPTTMTNPT